MGTPSEAAVSELRRFERDLDPLHPEAGSLPARVLGYGEMSTVLAIDTAALSGWALKRMSVFRSDAEVEAYTGLLATYQAALVERGLDLPDQAVVVTESGRSGYPILYLCQERCGPATIGNEVLRNVGEDEAVGILCRIVRAAAGVLGERGGTRLALDSQASNWSVLGTTLRYIDTGTPLMRVGGVEQLDPELFLRLCPASLRWVVRRFFLQDVLDRYYDLRLCAVDLLGNLHKERCERLLPAAIPAVNGVLAEVAPGTAPLTGRELDSYYRQDKVIWQLFLGFRRLERLAQTKRGRPYDTILPGHIER